MGLRSLFRTSRGRTETDFPAAVAAAQEPKPREPMSPEQLAELQEAWAELTQEIKRAGVLSLRACTRDGSSWKEDPAAVRGMAATIRKMPDKEAVDGE